MSIRMAGRAVLALGMVAGAMSAAAPARAYGYWNQYYGYAPRPVFAPAFSPAFWPRPVVVAPPAYYAPYYRPPVVYAPAPVYAPPPVRAYAAPRRPVARPVRQVKAAPRPPVPPGILDSPFAGPGRAEGIAPVSVVAPQGRPAPSPITPVPSPLPPPVVEPLFRGD